MRKLLSIILLSLPIMLLGQSTTTTVNVAPGTPVNLNAASGTAVNVRRPASPSSCSSAGTNKYRIGNGSGRVKLCITDWSNLSGSCGGGNNKEDFFRIYTDQNGDNNPETVYSYFSNGSAAASASMELNVTGPGVYDCQNCIMSPAGSSYIWVYFCGDGTCDAGDMANSYVSFTWESFPVSPNDDIGAAEPIDTCSQTFTANNYDATPGACGGYQVNWNNNLDCNTATALSPDGAPTNTNGGAGGGGDVGYSVESDIWFSFNPGLIGTWTLTFTPKDCFATNGISSGADGCDFYANGFQYALFEGTSATNFTSIVAGGTNGMNLNTAQVIPINVTTTTTNYYLQIEGYAGVGCEFDAVLTPPGAVCTLLPLPIQLLDFNAEMNVDNRVVDLTWSTATELNNDYFTIERSKDGEVFEVVGIVDGAGNSLMVKEYESADVNPYEGTSYYRLRQTDYDGDYTFSKVVPVENNNGIGDMTVFPNPVTGNANLMFNSVIAKDLEINVLDVTGRVVYNTSHSSIVGENKVNMSTNDLGQGMYFVTIRVGGNTETVKFLKN